MASADPTKLRYKKRTKSPLSRIPKKNDIFQVAMSNKATGTGLCFSAYLSATDEGFCYVDTLLAEKRVVASLLAVLFFYRIIFLYDERQDCCV